MHAVIKTGGKQYLVTEGQQLKIEKIDNKVDETINFEDVLLVFDDNNVAIGKPTLKTIVAAKVLRQAKNKKITVFKYKPKKRYHKKQGHRQSYTLVEVTKIGSKTILPIQKTSAPKNVPKGKAEKKEKINDRQK